MSYNQSISSQSFKQQMLDGNAAINKSLNAQTNAQYFSTAIDALGHAKTASEISSASRQAHHDANMINNNILKLGTDLTLINESLIQHNENLIQHNSAILSKLDEVVSEISNIGNILSGQMKEALEHKKHWRDIDMKFRDEIINNPLKQYYLNKKSYEVVGAEHSDYGKFKIDNFFIEGQLEKGSLTGKGVRIFEDIKNHKIIYEIGFFENGILCNGKYIEDFENIELSKVLYIDKYQFGTIFGELYTKEMFITNYVVSDTFELGKRHYPNGEMEIFYRDADNDEYLSYSPGSALTTQSYTIVNTSNYQTKRSNKESYTNCSYISYNSDNQKNLYVLSDFFDNGKQNIDLDIISNFETEHEHLETNILINKSACNGIEEICEFVDTNDLNPLFDSNKNLSLSSFLKYLKFQAEFISKIQSITVKEGYKIKVTNKNKDFDTADFRNVSNMYYMSKEKINNDCSVICYPIGVDTLDKLQTNELFIISQSLINFVSSDVIEVKDLFKAIKRNSKNFVADYTVKVNQKLKTDHLRYAEELLDLLSYDISNLYQLVDNTSLQPYYDLFNGDTQKINIELVNNIRKNYLQEQIDAGVDLSEKIKYISAIYQKSQLKYYSTYANLTNFDGNSRVISLFKLDENGCICTGTMQTKTKYIPANLNQIGMYNCLQVYIPKMYTPEFKNSNIFIDVIENNRFVTKVEVLEAKVYKGVKLIGTTHVYRNFDKNIVLPLIDNINSYQITVLNEKKIELKKGFRKLIVLIN